MKENFTEFIVKHLNIDLLISVIVLKFLTSLIDHLLFPLILNKKNETLDLTYVFENFIFLSIILITIYIISMSM